MRFLTFNLWHGLSPSSPVTMDALEPAGRRHLREELQIETVKKVEADVHFFQEVNPVNERAGVWARALKADCDSQPDLVGLKLLGLGLPFNLNSGLVTAVKKKWGMHSVDAVSLTRPGFRWVRGWASWQLREERFALFNETLLPGWGKVLLINTHLHHGLEKTEEIAAELETISDELKLPASAVSELKLRLAKGNQRRASELSMLLHTLEKHQNRYEAVVLAGDMNATAGNPQLDMLKEMGFRDAWAEANPNDPGLTFDKNANHANHLLSANFPLTLMVEDLSFSSRVKDALLTMARKHETRPRRIDFIWFRSNSVELKVKSAQLVGLPDANGFAPSDHFGVCADIEAV